MSPIRRLAPLALVGPLLAGCAAGTAADASPDPASSAASTGTTAATHDLSGELVVLAAASLQDTFAELGDMMMARHPGLTVTFSFGASSTLAQQALAGAPADVFAAANTTTMQTAAEVAGTPVLFAHNSLEIAVPPGNPAGVKGLADLANPDLTIALCAPEVPCGAAAVKAFQAAGLTPAPDTYEPDVKATLTAVVLGEVDAGLVYRTDVAAAGDTAQGIEFPEASAAVNDYPIAVLTDAKNPAAARAFVDLVLSPQGQKVLTDAGFDPA
ncbi:MAG: molybdate ABC transporter substrate-binding protein [Actinomycetales bacterium]|nr:molybdate ABC transporter substrate-binding protein [Actinomycetales bacterium]